MSPLPDGVREILEPALRRAGEGSWEEVERRVLERTAQLWLGEGCAVVTELDPDRIHGWLAGGSLPGIVKLVPRIEETAAFWGCKRATLHGRKGWLRVFEPLGYAMNGEVLEKRLV